ncbi:uncharacterized protein LOC104915774 [Meleagris gallopavo]|uniref:uncharacterized protein LOC104915774 n=1 Tax=Meleagris gallopavo TaxID=9103 RepID=UPI000938BED2|nr:uncharacterized protein LOC104915774 [Meleagris gallopavo]XP_019466555.1 uncharacterized protein LOC104915774 [Meleagris gallopavo]
MPGLAELMPNPLPSAAVRQPLVALLEAQLGLKVAELQHFSCGVSSGVSSGVSNGVSNGVDVREQLSEEQRRLKRLKERRWELAMLLQRSRRECGKADLRCLALLRELKALRAQQTKLELLRGDYLQTKGTAMLLKARLEELTLLVDTYSPEHLEAHRKIRSQLQDALTQTQSELAALRESLGNFVAVGPQLVAMAEEYRRLRDEIQHRQWALQQLRDNGEVNEEQQ